MKVFPNFWMTYGSFQNFVILGELWKIDWDQLVFGIQVDRIQQKLLDSRCLTLQTAIDVALSIESAAQDVK